MILLSLALVVASVGTLVWGMVTSSQPLVWTSLATGLAAVALVAGSVARRRTRLLAGPGHPGSAGSSAPTPPSLPMSAGGDPGSSPAHPGATGPSGSATPGTGRQPEYAGQDQQAQFSEPFARPLGEPFPEPVIAPPALSPPSVPPPSVPPPAVPPPGSPEPPATASVDRAPLDAPGEPPVEDVPIRDSLRVAQLPDEVVVRDGRPRYHLRSCPTLADATGTSALPVSVARRSGFTPCGVCAPDRTLLSRSRDRVRPDSAPPPG